MKFTVFNEDTYKYDLLAEQIYSREQEWFHYNFDKQNFEDMITRLPEGQAKNDLLKRLSDTITQMNIVENIHTSLVNQIQDQIAYQAAVERTAAKRAAQ